MNRLHVVLALIMFFVSFWTLPLAQADERTGWFVGGSVSLLELGASGDVETPNGKVRFEIQDPNAIGLTNNIDINSETTMGLGWESTQMPGGSLYIGYRSGFHWATHLDFFWALPKDSELAGYPSENAGDTYLEQQSTQSTYKTTRLMLDWRPLRPLPMWYLTAGLEYVEFNTRLEFRWQYENNGEAKRYYETFEDTGRAFGFVFGSGLQFSNPETPRQEWFINMSYAYVPFNDAYFAWDGDFLLGGLSLEGGARFYPGRGR